MTVLDEYIDRNRIVEFLEGVTDISPLTAEADKIRKQYFGDFIQIRGIIEFSNNCCRNCFYCGLRKDNNAISRFRMTSDEIFEAASSIKARGVNTVVLQSGDDFSYTCKMLCDLIKRIKENLGLAITVSVGERPHDEYKAFLDAGADRCLIKFETSNQELYSWLHPGMTLSQRLNLINALRNMGYQVGTGNIVGLPKQSFEDLANDVFLFKSLDPDMASVGPFVPQKKTPLGEFKEANLTHTIIILALTRIATLNSHMPVTTAIGTIAGDEGRINALNAGANVIMADFTPYNYRKDYVIYDNKVTVTIDDAIRILDLIGRKAAIGQGDSTKEFWRKSRL